MKLVVLAKKRMQRENMNMLDFIIIFTSNYHIVMFFREQWLANLARDSEIW